MRFGIREAQCVRQRFQYQQRQRRQLLAQRGMLGIETIVLIPQIGVTRRQMLGLVVGCRDLRRVMDHPTREQGQ